MTAAPEPTNPVARVQDVCNRLHRIATDAGRDDLAALLLREGGRFRSPETTIVFVGEEQQGKSSLVNALLGRAGLLPVDADVTTSAYLAVRHGEVALGRVIRPDAPPLEIDLDELARWATVDGNPGNELGVEGVVVELPLDLLADGLVLVDTPGVGGLVGGHAMLTLATLATADAVIFVTDAGSPFSRAELDFLAAATQRVDAVAFAVTKVDLHRGWAEIIEADHALLRRHAERFAEAPILPTSARLAALAEDATAGGRTDRATRARTESGIDALAAHVSAVGADSQRVRLGNLLYVADGVRTELARVFASQREAARDEATTQGQLLAEQERLERESAATAAWRADLDLALKRVGFDLEARSEATFAEVELQLVERIRGSRDLDPEAMALEVDAALKATWIDLATLVDQQVREVIGRLARELAIDGPTAVATGDLELPAHLERTGDLRRGRASVEDARRWEDVMLQTYPVLVSAGAPASIGGMLGAIGGTGASTLLTGPFGVVLGAGFAATMFFARRGQAQRSRDQRAAIELLRQSLVDFRRALARQQALHVLEVRRAAEEVLAGQLAARRRVIDDELRSLREIAKQDRLERQRTAVRASEQLAELDHLAETVARCRLVLSEAR